MCACCHRYCSLSACDTLSLVVYFFSLQNIELQMEESLRAGTNTAHQQATPVNVQDRRSSSGQSGGTVFNQGATYPFRTATTTAAPTPTLTPTQAQTPTQTPAQAEAINATLRHCKDDPNRITLGTIQKTNALNQPSHAIHLLCPPLPLGLPLPSCQT